MIAQNPLRRCISHGHWAFLRRGLRSHLPIVVLPSRVQDIAKTSQDVEKGCNFPSGGTLPAHELLPEGRPPAHELVLGGATSAQAEPGEARMRTCLQRSCCLSSRDPATQIQQLDRMSRQGCHCQTRTQSIAMWAGNWVEAFGDPGQSPPTARFSNRKKGWSKGQAAPAGSWDREIVS